METSGSRKKTRHVDLDTVLVEDLGQFGRYQASKLALCLPVVIFVSFCASEYVFTTARIPTRCLIPECDLLPPEWSPAWLENAAPAGEGCARYVAVNASAADPACPATLFDQSATVPCEIYVYENRDTVVYDFDMGCDEWSRSLIGSIRLIGAFVSMGISGFVSDRWGRRTALVCCAFNMSWLGIVRYWANTYWGFVISGFVETSIGMGGLSCAYILTVELIGPKYRVAVGASLNSFFTIGQVLLALLAWAIPDWRNLTLAMYIPMLATISMLWLMNESVRWLMSKERYDEAEKVLRKVAIVNRRYVSEETLIALRATNEEKKLIELKKQGAGPEPWIVAVVFKHKPILIRCIVCPVLWITCTFVYYGLSLNAVNLSGNRFVNYAAVSAVEIPGFWLAVYLLGCIGRKMTMTGAYWLCALSMVGFLLMPDDYFGWALTVYLIGKLSIAVVATSIWVYTTEIFPTVYRHRLFGFCNMLGRIGSIVAPLTPALAETVWEPFPFVLFGGLCVLSGLLMFLLPETLGTKLPDTLEEADQLGTKAPAPKTVPPYGEMPNIP